MKYIQTIGIFVICVLLANISSELRALRPVTRGDLQRIAKITDKDKQKNELVDYQNRIPQVMVEGKVQVTGDVEVNNYSTRPLDVNVQKSLDVNVQNTVKVNVENEVKAEVKNYSAIPVKVENYTAIPVKLDR